MFKSFTQVFQQKKNSVFQFHWKESHIKNNIKLLTIFVFLMRRKIRVCKGFLNRDGFFCFCVFRKSVLFVIPESIEGFWKMKKDYFWRFSSILYSSVEHSGTQNTALRIKISEHGTRWPSISLLNENEQTQSQWNHNNKIINTK